MTKEPTQSRPVSPILAIDLGDKMVGIAITDELQITIKRLKPLKRSNWKQLLLDIKALIKHYDAGTLVIGLPLRLDGTKGSAAEQAERLASNFSRSLTIPVFLQDERLTSVEARASLLAEGYQAEEVPHLIDGEAAALILRDYLNSREPRVPLSSKQNHRS